MTGKSFVSQFRISPGQRIRLKDFDPTDTGKYIKKDAYEKLEELRDKMNDLQQRLFAEHKRSLPSAFRLSMPVEKTVSSSMSSAP